MKKIKEENGYTYYECNVIDLIKFIRENNIKYVTANVGISWMDVKRGELKKIGEAYTIHCSLGRNTSTIYIDNITL